ncbi:ATP-binding cassette domain-containing protein [Streptomyces sp. NPDC052012]|uniref:ABC transporter ATP-binding protein n=1 Tax=Streptomyces sp. NPDC052012 TaxID=3155051 RepID=UPI00344EE803
MIQAIGLTSNPRKELPPAVDDVSFEAPAGCVTVLLGAPGAGKTTALRLMLELQQGRGITYFRGRPLHRVAHPAREVGVLLGDVPGHPARTVRGHLRMLCAATGVPVRRADEVLEAIGLVSLRDERLGTLSRGLNRRLGLACALLADPHTLVLDNPAHGLSVRENRWLYGLLRTYAAQGGTVLCTTADPKEAARISDRVVTLDQGRVVADQDTADFARTRLRPRVAVRSPHATRLSVLLTKEARAAQRSVEVVLEGGNRLSVYGSSCASIGETAFRHGIVVHQLADEIGDMGPGAAGPSGAAAEPQPDAGADADAEGDSAADEAGETAGTQGTVETGETEKPEETGEPEEAARTTGQRPSATTTGQRPSATTAVQTPPCPAQPEGAAANEQSPQDGTNPNPHHPDRLDDPDDRGELEVRGHPPRPPLAPLSDLPPPITVRPAPSPLRPLRYEIRRALGIGTGFGIGAAVLVVSVITAVLLARLGHTPQPRLLAAWPRELPLPPAALGAGLLGALAFGDEFRHPALAADRGTVPRRLGLLTAKLLVASLTALLLAVLTVGCDAEVLYLVYGRELVEVPADWLALSASWLGLVIGCAWAGVLAAGVFRSTTAGLAAVVAVPLLVVPLMHWVTRGSSVRAAAGFPARMRELFPLGWPFGGERYLEAVLRMIAQPVGGAMALSVATLLCAYLFTNLRSRVR